MKGLWNRFHPKIPSSPPLGTDDVLQRQRAGDEHRGDEGHPHRDLVGDDLRRGPHAAEKRPLVVGGPPREQDPDHHQGGDRHHVVDADIQVGGDQSHAEGDDHEGGEGADEDEVRRQLKRIRSAFAGMMSSLRTSSRRRPGTGGSRWARPGSGRSGPGCRRRPCAARTTPPLERQGEHEDDRRRRHDQQQGHRPQGTPPAAGRRSPGRGPALPSYLSISGRMMSSCR